MSEKLKQKYPLETTTEGAEEGNIDYVELLRTKLREKKLLYIADIVLEVSETSLSELLE